MREDRPKDMIRVTNTNNNKVVDCEILDVRGDKITVVLPGFQKLTLFKAQGKPNLYVANQFGMEFTAIYKR